MIPTRLLIYGGTVLAVVLGSGFIGYSWRDKSADKELAECQKTHAEAIATLLRAAQQAEADFRKQEQQIHIQQQEAVNDALQQAESAKADASRVRAALERLRVRAAASGGGSTPKIPPLPQQAKQPDKPSICQPTCSKGLERLLDSLLNTPTQQQ